MESFSWAKDKIFVPLAKALKSQNKSIESLFKDLAVRSDPNKINKRNFLIALKPYNAQIVVTDIDNLIKQLVDPNDKIDLPQFYKIYFALSGDAPNPDQAISKILEAINEYLQDERMDNFEACFDCISIDLKGQKKKVIEISKLQEFFAKQLSKIPKPEADQFIEKFKINDSPTHIDIEEIDKKLSPISQTGKKLVLGEEKPAAAPVEPVQEQKTYEDMMEIIRQACARKFIDIFLMYKEMDIAGSGLLSRNDLEDGIFRIGARLTPEEIESLFKVLDEDRDSKISYLELAKALETVSQKSQKVINQKEELYPIFAQIRNYVKDRKGLSISKVFRRETMKEIDSRFYIASTEFRNALMAMKIGFTTIQYTKLEKYLDPFNKGMIDYLYFCEKLGYLHKPDAEIVRPGTGMSAAMMSGYNQPNMMMSAYNPGMTGGMSQIMGQSQGFQFLGQAQMIKEFYHTFSKFVKQNKINLIAKFQEFDVFYTGLVPLSDFRRLIERLLNMQFTGAQINKVAEKYITPETQGKVNYKWFLDDLDDDYRKMNIINTAFLELYKYMSDSKAEDLMPLLEGMCAKGDKAMTENEFNAMLKEYCQMFTPQRDLLLVIKEFDTRNNNTVDLYEFDSQFKEFVKRKEQEGVIKRPDRHTVEVGLNRLRNYCNAKGISLMEVFKDCNLIDFTITQYEFQRMLKDLPDVNFEGDEIYALSADLTDSSGRLSLNLLLKMYTKLFNIEEESIETVIFKKEKDRFLRKIVDYAIKNHTSIEDTFAANDKERYGEIVKPLCMEILRNDLGLLLEKDETLKQLLSVYENKKTGNVKYTELLIDLKAKLEEQTICQKFLSKFKGHLIVNRIHLHDRFIIEDFLHEKFLTKDSIITIIRDTGFAYGTPEIVDCVMNLLPKDPKGKLNYIELENEIKRSPDIMFEEDETPLIKPDKIAPPDEVLDALAKKTATSRINLEDILINYDYDSDKKGIIEYNKFVEILCAVQVKGYNKYDLSGLADQYAQNNYQEVEYKKFVSALREREKKYEIEDEKTWLKWAERILEEISIKTYIQDKDCKQIFEEQKLLKENSKTMSYDDFKTGISQFGVQMTQGEFERICKELDTMKDKNVNVYEFSNLVQIKQHQARSKYERKLFEEIYNYTQKENIMLLDNLKAYDTDNTNSIPPINFATSIKSSLGSILSQTEIDYLIRKYTASTENNLFNYPAFVEDVSKTNSLDQLDSQTLTILDKLREGIRTTHVNLPAFFASKDKTSKGIIQYSMLFEVIPNSTLSEEEWKILAGIVDPYTEGVFDYQKLCQLLWIEDKEFKSKEADSIKLTKKIAAYCKSKRIDLGNCFVRSAKDRTGFMSTNDIKQVFDTAGITLSYSELNSLLYYQPISTDISGRKNYLELLHILFGTSAATAKKLAEVPESVLQINEASKKVEAEIKASFKGSVAAGPQITPLEELKSYKPENYKGYRSIFFDKLLENIVKYTVNSKINLIEHFKNADQEKTGILTRREFFNVMDSLNMGLTEKDEAEIMNLPGISENNTHVKYIPFVNCVLEKNYEMGAAGELRSPKYNSSQAFHHSRVSSTDQKINTEIRELTLTEEEMRYAAGLLKALKMHMDTNQHKYAEVFSRYDPQKTGFITIKAFYEALKSIDYKFLDFAQINQLYSYLKEDKDGFISLKRLHEALEKGYVLKQYRTESKQAYLNKIATSLKTAQVSMDRLRNYLVENQIPANKFRDFAKTNEKFITRIEFYESLKGIEYKALSLEADQIFDSIMLPDDGNKGSLNKLIDLMSKNPEKERVIQNIDPKMMKVLDMINEKLRENSLSLEAFGDTLDVNGDGYIDYTEFVNGCKKQGVNASDIDLYDLAKMIDANGNNFLSINELGLYLFTSKKTAQERKKELGIDDILKHEIERVFMVLDTDHNGKIDENELYRGLVASKHGKITRDEVSQIMRTLDANNNGSLDFDEFKNYMMDQIKNDILTAEDSMEDLRQKFIKADLNGNGWISTEELYELVKKEYPKVKIDELTALIAECDTNKDMKIDIDEFVNYFIKPYQRLLDIKKNKMAYNGLLAIKAHRRISASEFLSIFDRIAGGGLYFPSFISNLHQQMLNLPSEGFTLKSNTTGVGYRDIIPSPANATEISPIIPNIAGYVVLSGATGVPIPANSIFDRARIAYRQIKLCFYDGKTKQFIYNTAAVDAEWDENMEDQWNVNKDTEIGTNPIAFKWSRTEEISEIKLIFEFVLGIKKAGKILEVSNGWAELPLENLRNDQEFTLPLKAGTPQKPLDIDPKEVRTDRKGFFSTIAKALGSKINSQITLHIRSLPNIELPKQVFF